MSVLAVQPPTLRMTKSRVPSRDVQRMQALLLVAGFKVRLDGVFDADTLAQLNAFQWASKLEVDGMCGPKTWVKLLGG